MEYKLENHVLSVTFQTLGGALHSIQTREDGLEYLWQGEKQYWSGQAPVLFPICGSIRDDRARTAGGKELHMPRHGIVRKREFECREQTEDSILFTIESDEETYQMFPYHFRLGILYRLEENRIVTEYLVENTGEEEMPYFIGGHPGFNCPLFQDEEYQDYRIEFEQEETCTVPRPVTETGLIDMEHRTEFLSGQRSLPLSHTLFEKDAVILDSLKSRRVRLCSGRHDRGVELTFDGFPYLILWSSANSGPFVALEPWTGLSTCSDEGDVFEEKRNVQSAGAGEVRKYAYTITVY